MSPFISCPNTSQLELNTVAAHANSLNNLVDDAMMTPGSSYQALKPRDVFVAQSALSVSIPDKRPRYRNYFDCVQTTANVLQFFALRTSKQDAVPHLTHSAAHSANSAGAQPELKRMELFLERSVLIEGSAMAADIVGDSRAIVVSCCSLFESSTM